MAEHVTDEEWREAKGILGGLLCWLGYIGLLVSVPAEVVSWLAGYTYLFWLAVICCAALMVVGGYLGAKSGLDPKYLPGGTTSEQSRAAKRADAKKPRFDPIYVLSWQDAERSARDFLRLQGFTDARLTSPGADGGVDVVSVSLIAQVKHQTRPVGEPAIVQLFGTTHRKQYQGRLPMFFSSSGYTPKAIKAARELGVTLYQLHGSQHWKKAV